MSRIGNRILSIPESVTVTLDNDTVTVKGPKGELKNNIDELVTIKVEDNKLSVARKNETKHAKQMHGTTNSNINNMIIGVTEGFSKGLEIIGVGYRFNVSGKSLTINAGYSHPVKMEIPVELTIDSESNTLITVKGIDKILVGEYAAKIRKVRKPEPYKGKGIRYQGEHVRRKEGKKAA